MGKGKKKSNKGKKRGGKKNREDTCVGDSSRNIPPELMERARLAAASRTEDPLKNWTRLQNEECPICMLPLPLGSEISYCVTCGTTVCVGCQVSSVKVHRRDGKDAHTAIVKATTCPYCRSSTAIGGDKFRSDKTMKLANAGHHEAMHRVGNHYFMGEMCLRQDKAEGLKWYHRALEAGSGLAAFSLGCCYYQGDGVEKDIDKALEYLQKAAELGFIKAFHNIGILLVSKGEIEEAMLNYRKAAICGDSHESVFKSLRDGFKDGYITKDEYAFTLRENQKACNEMKREAMEEFRKDEREQEIWKVRPDVGIHGG